jgi:hypothetical protein
MNSLQQQAKFDAFLKEFNTERPHEAIEMKCPAEFYRPSTWAYLCEALESTREDLAVTAFERLFKECGVGCRQRLLGKSVNRDAISLVGRYTEVLHAKTALGSRER